MVRALSAEGMSARAIAPILGVSDMQVGRDIKAGATNVAPAPRPRYAEPTEAQMDAYAASYVNTETGELTDTPSITGMDGKQYARPDPAEAPKPKRRPITDQGRHVGAATERNTGTGNNHSSRPPAPTHAPHTGRESAPPLKAGRVL